MNQLGELADQADTFAKRGAQVVALAQQDAVGAQSSVAAAQEAQQAARGQTFPLTVLADPQSDVARAYDVADWNSAGENQPAVFIIDSAGLIVWSYISTTDDDRPNAAQILQHLP
jgi:alkyl hydroperoxide reductase subunit AhpC